MMKTCADCENKCDESRCLCRCHVASLACECGCDFETQEEFDAHLKSDYKDHPIKFDPCGLGVHRSCKHVTIENLQKELAASQKRERIYKEALQYLNIHNGGHIPSKEVTVHAKCNQCVIEDALAQAGEGKDE